MSDDNDSSTKQRHSRRKTNMDISIPVEVQEDDAPSPIPSPYVGTLHKGSRRRRQQRQQQIMDEEASAPPYSTQPRKRASSLERIKGSSMNTTPSMIQHRNGNVSTSNDTAAPSPTVTFEDPLLHRDANASNDRYTEKSPLLLENASSDSDNVFDDDDDDDGGGHERDFQDDNVSNVATILETIGESAQIIYQQIEEAVEEAVADYEERRRYDWREFWKGGSCVKFIQWFITGLPSGSQSTEEIQDNLNSLARMIALLREYMDKYGMPNQGGPKDQSFVLREVTRDLYAGGCPIWALQPVLKTAAEGLTGRRNIDFFMLPRRTFMFDEGQGGTTMFSMTRGYDMRRLDDMEAVAVRLASFASNTSSSASVPVRWAQPSELRQAFRSEVLLQSNDEEQQQHPNLSTPEELATEILDLASEAEGLFFFLNAHRAVALRDKQDQDDEVLALKTELGAFWKVDESLRTLFSHLACIDAMQHIDKMDTARKPLYSPWVVTLFRVGASSGACAFWFNGSWLDIVVSGLLAVLIAWIGASPVLTSQERLIFEAVASFIVGLVAALIALTWPGECCFGAMAISGVLDLLQGFRVVYSIIEIMSRHTVTGGADFLEGVFFTTLIAYFLRFGLYAAVKILGNPESDEFQQCNKGVSHMWYFLFVPVAAVSWSGLFNPYKIDLPFMALHGILGYLVSLQFYNGPFSQLHNFMAAAIVTFSAGIFSRFTGRQALGNTVAGIYVLLPGAYLLDEVFKNRLDGFLASVILRACIIGVGAWTGTVLCSPTLLGRSKDNAISGPSLGAPALTGPIGLQRTPSDASFPVSESSVRVDGSWTRRRRGRRNPQSLFLF